MKFRPFLSVLLLLAAVALFAGCETTDWQGIQSTRIATENAIKAEEPGDYWIGRRYYKVDYKFWGWLRRPGQPWSTAKLVMMNEQQKLAPDRAAGSLGSDNGVEYKLYGTMNETPVYEPSSNGFYPEFVLKGYEVRSATPPNIYRISGATDPTRRIIARPY